MIGQGQYSVVYRATQIGLASQVAVKIILPEYASSADFIRQFEIEYRHIARLNHPNIVSLLDYWRDPDGGYLIMPYFSGTLKMASPVQLDVLVKMAEQICRALGDIHRQNLFHRNLKPENILLDDEHNIYISDFGTSLTAENQPAHTSSDIYGIGMLLYFAVTGKWMASSNHLPDFDDYGSELNEVIQKAVARNPEDRFANTTELLEAFRMAVESRVNAVKVANTALDHFINKSSGIRWRFEQEQRNPYKGLYPFEETDAKKFFGREAITENLLARLKEDSQFKHFVALVGPSGSGKSSVIRAGLIPALRNGALPESEKWFVATMTPKSDSIRELETALLSVAIKAPDDIAGQLSSKLDSLNQLIEAILPEKGHLVLFIDQFEELFTLEHDPASVIHFLNLIMTTVSSANSLCHVLITLRADFYDRPLMYPDFSTMMSQRTGVIVPLTVDELERAIVRPLEQLGVTMESDLVPTIIAEVNDNPGTLPMLQYALRELFERREGDTISLKDYHEIGGIMGALTRHAEMIYESLNQEQQVATRQLFLRLIIPGEGTEDTRRQARRLELSSMNLAEIDSVIEIFGNARLLTFDNDSVDRQPTVEVAHEALIREWKRLRIWLDESREDLRQQRQLAITTRQWQRENRDRSFLAAGSRLEQLENWFNKTGLTLSKNEEAFVQASIAERDRQILLEEKRQVREKTLEQRARRFLTTLTVVSLFGAVIAIGLAVFALNQRAQAVSSATEAETRRIEAEQAQQESERNANISHERALISNAQLALYRDYDTDLAVALSLETTGLGYLPAEEFRVLTETVYTPGTRAVYPSDDRLYKLDLSSDGQRVLAGSRNATIRYLDLESGEEILYFEGHEAVVWEAIFSPDEQLVASASLDNTVRIWNAGTGEVIHVFDEFEGQYLSVAFSPDGRYIAAAGIEPTIHIWDVETGDLLQSFADNPDTDEVEGHTDMVWGLVFSPDGQRLISSGRGAQMYLWDIENGQILRQFDYPDPGAGITLYNTVFSEDGQTIYTPSFDGTVAIWDIESGELRLTLEGHTGPVYNISLSADEQIALTASADNSIRRWNLETGAEITRYIGHTDRVFDVQFLPDETQFISSSYDATIRLWDIETSQSLLEIDGESVVYQLNFSSDGTRLLSAHGDQQVKLWDVQSGDLIRVFGSDDTATDSLEGHSDLVLSAIFSPDESMILSSDQSGLLFLWDAGSGEIIRTYEYSVVDTENPEMEPQVWRLLFSPDAENFYSSAFDFTVAQWDTASGEVIHRFGPDNPETEEIEGHSSELTDIALINEGKQLLSTGFDGLIILWDTETGEIIRIYEGHTNWVWWIALSPDETQFLSASADQSLILWDIESGESLNRMTGHEDSVLSVDFGPGGEWAVTSGRDSQVMLWNLAAGTWVRNYIGHTAQIRAVDHSPVGNIFATGDNNGKIILWERLSIDEIVSWTYENRYVRILSCDEMLFYQLTNECE